MTQKDDDKGMSRVQEKFAEKQSKVSTEGFDKLRILGNLLMLVTPTYFFGVTGFALGLYAVIGLSLANRMDLEHGLTWYLGVALSWPLLLGLDVVAD